MQLRWKKQHVLFMSKSITGENSPPHSKPAEYSTYVDEYNSNFCILLDHRCYRIRRNAYWLVDIFKQLQLSFLTGEKYTRFQKAKCRDISDASSPKLFLLKSLGCFFYLKESQYSYTPYNLLYIWGAHRYSFYLIAFACVTSQTLFWGFGL